MVTGVVLDTSIAACWAFSDESHELAGRTLDFVAGERGWVPALWWYEVRNALIINERRGRIDREGTAAFLRSLSKMPIMADSGHEERAVLTLARTHSLTVYDAAYLELSLRRGLPLATLDKVLRKAAKKEGVALF